MTADFQHLLAYGYAPGHYMNKCRTCEVMHYDLDKRARSCRPCAQARYDDDQAAALLRPPEPTLRACPFCGHQPEEDNLYDSVHRVNREGTLWTAGCVDNEGGCNASVLAGSRAEAIAKWNARAEESQSLAASLAKVRASSARLGKTIDEWDQKFGDKSLPDKLWASAEVMSLNAELGLTMDQLVRLAQALKKANCA